MPSPLTHLKKQNLAVIVIGAVLVGYIAFLLMANYYSKIELQKSGLERMRHHTEKHAVAVSYYISERKNDLKNLTEDRRFSAFFENKALGMSMEYGLGDSVFGIAKSFDRFLENRRIGGDRIYTRIALLESNGAVLVDRPGNSSNPATDQNLKKFLDPEHPDPQIIVEPQKPFWQIIVSMPYFYKGAFSGQIIAWISPETLYRHMVKAAGDGASQCFSTIINDKGEPFYSTSDLRHEGVIGDPYDFNELYASASREVHRFESSRENGFKVDMIAMRVPIPDMPFFLVEVAPAAEVLGHAAPRQLLAVTGILSLAILGGVVIIVRVNTRNLLLHARFEEASQRRQEVEDQNRQLEKEIRERQLAEEAVREGERFLANIFNSIQDGIIILDTDFNIIRVNPAMERWYAHALPLVGQKCYEAYHKRSEPCQVCPNRQTLESGEVASEVIPKIGAHGEVAGWLEVYSFPLVDTATGKMKGVIDFIRDITEQKQAEEALRQSEEQLRQAQKMEAVGRLAGGVAHDFNNILTGITGYSELLLMDFKDHDSRPHDVEEIKNAAERAASLTRQLLAFSRKQMLQMQPLDLNVVVANMDRMLKRIIGEDIELATIPAPGLATVKADPGQMEQVILNLAVNARDAMPQGGKLTVETANLNLDADYTQQHLEVKAGPYVMLAISDTGVGLDKETQSRIFEPFFTTKEQGQGTGLGLATVYGIIKQSGGHIYIYSEPGQGTTFKIYLPRLEDAVASAPVDQATTAPVGGPETILLVEDEDMVRQVARRILERNGYTVKEAGLGAEALLLSGQNSGPIHLLLTDVVMAGMSGRELADRLSLQRPEMKVLYMSGHTENAIVHHGVLDQGIAFIQKPFRHDILVQKVREVLDRPPPGPG